MVKYHLNLTSHCVAKKLIINSQISLSSFPFIPSINLSSISDHLTFWLVPLQFFSKLYQILIIGDKLLQAYPLFSWSAFLSIRLQPLSPLVTNCPHRIVQPVKVPCNSIQLIHRRSNEPGMYIHSLPCAAHFDVFQSSHSLQFCQPLCNPFWNYIKTSPIDATSYKRGCDIWRNTLSYLIILTSTLYTFGCSINWLLFRYF